MNNSHNPHRYKIHLINKISNKIIEKHFKKFNLIRIFKINLKFCKINNN